MTERVAEPRLDEIRQMCDGPGDGFTQGEWCWAANDLLRALDATLARVSSLETALAECDWLYEVANDFLCSEYPRGTGHPADAEAARLSRAVAKAGAALNTVRPAGSSLAGVSDGPTEPPKADPTIDPDDPDGYPHAYVPERIGQAPIHEPLGQAPLSDGPTEPQPEDLGVASPSGSARCSNPDSERSC